MSRRAIVPLIVLLAVTLQSCASSSTGAAQSQSQVTSTPSTPAVTVTDVIENAISTTVKDAMLCADQSGQPRALTQDGPFMIA
jgi:hypothetical protein